MVHTGTSCLKPQQASGDLWGRRITEPSLPTWNGVFTEHGCDGVGVAQNMTWDLLRQISMTLPTPTNTQVSTWGRLKMRRAIQSLVVTGINPCISGDLKSGILKFYFFSIEFDKKVFFIFFSHLYSDN